MKNLTIEIASLPDREDVVAEIWFGNDQVAEVSTDPSGEFVVEIYAPTGRTTWRFGLDDLQRTLDRAKENLNKKPR